MLKLRSYFVKPNSTIKSHIYKVCLSTSPNHNRDRDESSNLGKDKPRKDEDELQSKKSDALKKLNSLLNTMVEDEYISASTKSLNNQMARPKSQVKKVPKASLKPEAIVVAAKVVAESLGGDVQQTQSELLTKLRSQREPTKASMNLNELIVGMKIDRSKKPTSSGEGRSLQVRHAMSRDDSYRPEKRRDHRRDDGHGRQDEDFSYSRQILKPGTSQRVDLFNNEALGIFMAPKEVEASNNNGPVLSTWEELSKRELRIAVTHPPSNIFEEMILWTEQGKLWQFPIDNEQGLEEEKSVYFAEHLFLEPHLEPWCPRKGPVRHFMELVCVGLSKNPYFTVQEKREHIDWFRKYFDEKRSILQETGALEGSQKAEVTGDTNV